MKWETWSRQTSYGVEALCPSRSESKVIATLEGELTAWGDLLGVGREQKRGDEEDFSCIKIINVMLEHSNTSILMALPFPETGRRNSMTPGRILSLVDFSEVRRIFSKPTRGGKTRRAATAHERRVCLPWGSTTFSTCSLILSFHCSSNVYTAASL